MAQYPHLTFRRDWQISHEAALLLGECDGLVKALYNSPILPEHRRKLLNVSLIKGAQATTAIEGNTLSEEDIAKIQQGVELSPSKRYMQEEVKNILNAFSEIFKSLVKDGVTKPIDIELLLHFHKIIGANLGEHFDAIPGRFRTDNRIVGTYRCPDYADVPSLMDRFFNFLQTEFGFWSGRQRYSDAIIQAIVAHAYLEWIHPFGDGNGRTGRLLEFYILARAKTPDIASHILSNHYNQTRSEYYRQLSNATSSRDLTSFIEYALLGFRDGLAETLDVIRDSQLQITWEAYIYKEFDKIDGHEKVRQRKRTLLLEMPPGKEYTAKEIILASPKIALIYGKASLTDKQIERELEDLTNRGFLLKESGTYKLNVGVLSGFMPLRMK